MIKEGNRSVTQELSEIKNIYESHKIIYSSLYGEFNTSEKQMKIKEFSEMMNFHLDEIPTDVKDDNYYDSIQIVINMSLGRYLHKMHNKYTRNKIENLSVPIQPNDFNELKSIYELAARELIYIGFNKYSEDSKAFNLLFNEASIILLCLENADRKFILAEMYHEFYEDYKRLVHVIKASRMSQDPHTQVGAIVVHGDVIGEGSNTFPEGCTDLPVEREGDYLKTKYPFIVHAEANAILDTLTYSDNCDGATLYVNLFPCNECAKLIIQSGITEVVYWEKKYADKDFIKAAEILFEKAGVNVRKFGLCL